MTRSILFIFMILLSLPLPAQIRPPEQTKLLTVFWNLENLFRPDADSTYADTEYLPDAPRHWTWGRYRRKLKDIASTLISIRDCTGIYPDAVGLAEVENGAVMKDLIFSAPMVKLGYSYVHFESPDLRGIDVAFLYRRKRLKVLDAKPVAVPLPGGKPTRDILYVKALFRPTADTVHFFVNHWPSKFGGERISVPKRETASRILMETMDSVLCREEDARMIVMGDFNDTRESPPVAALNALLENPPSGICSPLPIAVEGFGTNKFRNRWHQIDLMLFRGKIVPEGGGSYIYAPCYLLVEDRKYSGFKMNRTYLGPRYAGGISDHLPVFASFIFSSLKPKASLSLGSPTGSM